jgi:hypothetical protein
MGQIQDVEKLKLAEKIQEDRIAQEAIENKNREELLGLRKAADLREQEILGDTQARQARQDFTADQISQIIAEPDIKKRQELLAGIRDTAGGFAPSVQESKLLADLTTAATPDYTQPDMYRVGKDGSVESFKPRTSAEEKAYADAGWKYGEYKAGPKDKTKGLGGYKPKEIKQKFNTFRTRVGEYGSVLSDDVKKAQANIDRLEAYNIHPDTVEAALTKMETDNVDKTFEKNDLNKYFPAVINPKTGTQVKFGDALEQAEADGISITMDAKGNYTLVNVPKSEETPKPKAASTSSVLPPVGQREEYYKNEYESGRMGPLEKTMYQLGIGKYANPDEKSERELSLDRYNKRRAEQKRKAEEQLLR